jgi:hypothetical protein
MAGRRRKHVLPAISFAGKGKNLKFSLLEKVGKGGRFGHLSLLN